MSLHIPHSCDGGDGNTTKSPLFPETVCCSQGECIASIRACMIAPRSAAPGGDALRQQKFGP